MTESEPLTCCCSTSVDGAAVKPCCGPADSVPTAGFAIPHRIGTRREVLHSRCGRVFLHRRTGERRAFLVPRAGTGLLSAILLLLTWIASDVLAPALLPWLPGRQSVFRKSLYTRCRI